MMTTRHRWTRKQHVGHGSGDGTPAGVYTTRRCLTCGAAQCHDTAASTSSGGSRARWTYRDAWGNQCESLPICVGYDPLTQAQDDQDDQAGE